MKKIIIIFAITVSILTACNKWKHPVSGTLSFSTDTVFFDTIFTQIGSTTKKLKIHNKGNKALKINKIFVANGQNSKYRLNIDGYAQNSVDDIIIDAKDSLYIFVEVTINPQRDDIVEADSLIFISGDHTQSVQLLAVGKDVILIDGKYLQTQTWTAEKPYLIYNSIAVDTLQTLTIEAGTEIYSHRDSYIFVKGTLHANGTKEMPITFKGDRIDDDYYLDKPGQWNGIIFLPGSFNNYLNYVEIKQSVVGVEVINNIDNLEKPTLLINNSEIMHCSYIGVYCLSTNVTVLNSIIADCGYHNVGLISGKYNFFNCTIQNDYVHLPRNSPAVAVTNYMKLPDNPNQLTYTGAVSAFFANSIIYGNQTNEFLTAAYDTVEGMSLSLENCLLRLDPKIYDFGAEYFKNCVINQDPIYFIKPDDPRGTDDFDYHLSENSPARAQGNPEIIKLNQEVLGYDKDGIKRLSDNTTDIGAYEFQ